MYILLRPGTPRRNLKNLLEYKHGFIRSIYLHLVNEDAHISSHLAAQRAIRIYNNQYGLHVHSAFELSNGYRRPIGISPLALSANVFEAHEIHYAKSKLSKIIQRKPTHDVQMSVGDLGDFNVRLNEQTRGK